MDAFALAKIRMDMLRWEDIINDAYLVLRAVRGPVEALGTIYADKNYKTTLKTVAVEMSVILDNFKMPEGW